MSAPNASPSSSTFWHGLSTAADDGHLYLDPDVARRCDSQCARYLEQLNFRLEEAVGLADVSGYGDFESGHQLARMFSERAVGGPNNMVDVIDSHIQVVKKMQTVFQKFFTQYADNDAATATEIARTGPN